MSIVVVGAGLAGLAAARRLQAAGRSVVVVEARPRVGGRVCGGTLAGHPVELGGAWLGEGHDRMYGLVAELGLETFPTYNEDSMLVQLGGKRSRMSSRRGAVPRLNPFELADLAQGLLRFNRLARRVGVDRPWAARGAEELDGQTFETWIRRTLRTPAGRAYFRIATEAVLSTDSADVSLLHMLFYAQANTDLETLLATEGGAQKDRVIGGTIRVAERLAEELDIRLGEPVGTVRHSAGEVEVTTRSGARFEGEHVIVAIPPTLAGRLEYDPVLPGWRDQLTQKLPAGSVVKVLCAYATPFWRANGLNGQVASDQGPAKVVFDVSPPGAEVGILLAFVEGGDARRWTRLGDADRRRLVLDRLVDHFGAEARTPMDYLEQDWTAEEFSRGCYSAHFAPGVWTSYGEVLRPPIGRVHWAGTEYATRWNGYMEGAVLSGEAAADEILA